MCGRYAFFAPPHRLVDLLGIDITTNLEPRYNAAPMQEMPIVVHHKLGKARWGFVPSWSNQDNTNMAARMINARSETVSEKPAFRDAWKARRRCLIPANGFYEWVKDENVSAPSTPYYIHSQKPDDILFFAGLWSKIENLVTFTILTKQADHSISKIHHRMPVLVKEQDVETWFKGTNREASECIKKASADILTYHAVHPDVGNVKNDREDLIHSIAA